MRKLIFSIETSCDETSVSILAVNKKILSHITVSQKDHGKFGGVVPEIASRAHLQILQKIIPKAINEAKINIDDIDFFCATCGPGLIGGLLVGSTLAKSMAVSLNKPFFPINHLEGHLLSPSFSINMNFPNITFLLTGGHTQIYLLRDVGKYELLGETIDDAVGETFDKVAKLLDLDYPGGPALEKIAKKGKFYDYRLPHPLKFRNDLNFSFSGIKTAVNLIIKKETKMSMSRKSSLAKIFQDKVIEILIAKADLVFRKLKPNHDIRDISLVGGVAANKSIRKSFEKICKKNNYRLIVPPINLCGDNAAMIALACIEKVNKKISPDLNFVADPRLKINQTFIQ